MMPRHNLAFLGDHIKGHRTEHSFLMPQKHLPDSEGRTSCTLGGTQLLTDLKGRNFDSVVLTELDKLVSLGQHLHELLICCSKGTATVHHIPERWLSTRKLHWSCHLLAATTTNYTGAMPNTRSKLNEHMTSLKCILNSVQIRDDDGARYTPSRYLHPKLWGGLSVCS